MTTSLYWSPLYNCQDFSTELCIDSYTLLLLKPSYNGQLSNTASYFCLKVTIVERFNTLHFVAFNMQTVTLRSVSRYRMFNIFDDNRVFSIYNVLIFSLVTRLRGHKQRNKHVYCLFISFVCVLSASLSS